MSDLGTQEFTPTQNLSIQELQDLSLRDFRSRFSSPTTPPHHFADSIGYFTTNEIDYPNSLDEIKARGGLHLAIMGGLDPVFGQIAVAHPDLTIITDINDAAIDTAIDGRVLPLENSQIGEEYWGKVKDYFRNVIRKKDPKRSSQDNTKGR